MCGIAGIIKNNSIDEKKLMAEMLSALAHRGPEDEGIWESENKKVVLGQRRLAILDLSPLGHQPMTTKDNRYSITFNGEIYNYQDIKTELQELGWEFFSTSDTEVLLYAYAQWKEKCLEKLNGMFAFAVWDEAEQTLFAARDRLGEKPFKYYYDGDNLLFASELKAILRNQNVPREIDWQAIDIAMSLRFVPSPMTGFKDIKKLPAGHFLKWHNGAIEIVEYWRPGEIKPDQTKTLSEWKKDVWDLFVDSVKKRLISDVPIGAFLSGGVDSTSVVAALNELKHPLNTYVISIGGQSDDSKYAELAAKFFGTKHKHIELSAENLSKAVERLVDFYDEPFFDASALPSMLISEAMKPEVTVVLSGDGGDELFGGYSAYQFVKKLSFIKRVLPTWIKIIIPAINKISPALAYRLEILSNDFYQAYCDYFSTWKSKLPITRKYLTKDDLFNSELKQIINPTVGAKLMKEWFGASGELSNDAMVADLSGRLPDGYLAKTDFATMAAALEIRPPFLDYRLAELAEAIPEKFKIKGAEGKWLWKEIIKDRIPSEIINRKKSGFSIPLDKILKDELRLQAEDILLNKQSLVSKYFDTETMSKLWQDHLSNKADYSNHIWSIIMLELWLKKYLAK